MMFPWAKIASVGAVVMALIFALHMHDAAVFARGESKVRGQWQKALDNEMKATAAAQGAIHASAMQAETVRVEKVSVAKKLVADYVKAADTSNDEATIYALARASIFRLRLNAGLPTDDCAPTAAS